MFSYSAIHTLSLFVTHPLGIVAGLKALNRVRSLSD